MTRELGEERKMDIEYLLEHMQVLHLREGDMVVLSVPDKTPVEQIGEIGNQMDRAISELGWKNVKCFTARASDFRFGVLRHTEGFADEKEGEAQGEDQGAPEVGADG